MATAEDYAGWIVANSDKAGTPEFQTVAQAYQLAKSQSQSVDKRSQVNANPAAFASAEDRAMANPTSAMSGTSKFLSGAGKAFSDIGSGVKQLLGGDNQAAIDESKRLDAPLMATGAGAAGNIAGNVATTLPSAFIPGVNGMVGGAALGAGLGAIQPVASGDSRATNMAIGAAGGAAVPAIGAALRTGKSIIEPLYSGGRDTIVGRTLNRVAGDNAPSVQTRLANALELVPGSAPTAAEVAESGGVAALQRAASAADPESYATRSMQQASARADALRGIAGTPQDLANAKSVRELMSESLYREARDRPIDASLAKAMKPQIDNLMQRPSIQRAVERARQIFGEETVVLAKEGSPRGLQMVKQALDDMIEKAGSPTSSIGKNELRALEQTRRDLYSTMEDLTPKLREADKAFASWSPAVDQHKLGAALVNKLEPALNDYGALGNETSAQFARALRNETQTLKGATGFGGNRELSDVLSPSQMNTVENIGKDLARKSNAQNLGRGAGSDTMQKLSMSNIGEQSGMPRLVDLVSSLPGISRATNWVYRDTDNQIRARMAQALLNPKESAQLMREANGNPQLAKALLQVQRVAIPAGAALPLANSQ